MVTVRFDPLPPKTIFASGTRSWLEERPLTVKLLAGVSTSPIENGMAAVGVYLIRVLFTHLGMLGGAFCVLNDNIKLALAAAPSPSVTVRVILGETEWI